jgi:hypothetical protein
VGARVAAFAAIVVAGLAGALIGDAFVGLSCAGGCSTGQGIGALVGAVLSAGGVAVVSVLVLRAMGEWRTIAAGQAAADARHADADGENQP